MSMRVLFKTSVNVADNQGCRVFETEFEYNGNNAYEDCYRETKLKRVT